MNSLCLLQAPRTPLTLLLWVSSQEYYCPKSFLWRTNLLNHLCLFDTCGIVFFFSFFLKLFTEIVCPIYSYSIWVVDNLTILCLVITLLLLSSYATDSYLCSNVQYILTPPSLPERNFIGYFGELRAGHPLLVFLIFLYLLCVQSEHVGMRIHF